MRILLVLASSLTLIAEIAAAQTGQPRVERPGMDAPHMSRPEMAGPETGRPETERPGMGRPHMRSHHPGAAFSIDRGTGRGRIEIHCAGRDTTRDCVEAVLPLLDILPPDGTQGSGVAFATTSIKCGDTVYEVSTGTSGGNCSVAGPEDGPRNSTGCNDGGNRASASCQTGCGATSGSGSCTIKTAQ